jgi:HEPN domain-containing protein
MNENVAEWIDKADGDFRTAQREFAVSDQPNFDAVCYHAQQCVEKLMKGVLIHRTVVPPKTHDLLHLDKLLRAACPSWDWSRDDLRWLTRAAVAFRYPGGLAGPEHAEKAFRLCSELRAEMMTLLAEEYEGPRE